MTGRLPRRIERTANDLDVTSITVDVFDTLLLRTVWPEGIQFLEVADEQAELLRDKLSIDVSTYEFYAWRNFARRTLIDAESSRVTASLKAHDVDVDITLRQWFEVLCDSLANKHNTSLDSDERRNLVDELIRLELAHEVKRLKPNNDLASILRKMRRANPHLHVYFVSDMYLESQQIVQLLDAHGIADVVDGGISSVEVQRAKHSGNLYHYLHSTKHFGDDFDLYRNLHIGDNAHSDDVAATLAGSHSFHYKPRRFRHARTAIGYYRLHRIRRAVAKAEYRRLRVELTQESKRTSNVLARSAALFAQPMAIFLHYLGIIARSTEDDTAYVFVSSEGRVFLETANRLYPGLYDGRQNIVLADKLNRKTMLKACLWSIINSNIPAKGGLLTATARYGELSQESRSEVYDFILTPRYPISEMSLNQYSTDEFEESLEIAVSDAESEYTEHLRQAFEYVYHVVNMAGNRNIVVVDLGWGGTVQTLLGQFLQMEGVPHRVEGLYVGCHPPSRFPVSAPKMTGLLMPNVLESPDREIWNPVIWEYIFTNKPQFVEDADRLRHIDSGLTQGYELFRAAQLNPYDYFDLVIRPELSRLISAPSKAEILALGSIRFDTGFSKEDSFRVIDLTVSRPRMYRQLVRHPRRTLRYLTQSNIWTQAHIRHYHLYGLNTILGVARSIRLRMAR